MGNLTEAARSAWTHSYMVPGDKEMVTNVEYYKSRGIEDKWFTPRQEAVDYVLRNGVMRLISFNCRFWQLLMLISNSLIINTDP